MSKFSGGCDHIHTHSNGDPISNHICHCSVCKRVTGQPTTHVVFFHHSDLEVDNADGINKQPFNDQNPDGPGESWTCSTCGTPIVMNDKLNRIRAIVPNLMGYSDDFPKATYHAYYDASTGVPRPNDGREVHEGLHPEFVWPEGSQEFSKFTRQNWNCKVRNGAPILKFGMTHRR